MKGYNIVNRKFSITVWPLLAAAAILCAVAPAKAAEREPNIVFMLMDNLGYGELGVYGGGILRGAPTPRIDKLASEGMRLLNFNVESQCTATRSALMTGRFPIGSGTYKVPIGVCINCRRGEGGRPEKERPELLFVRSGTRATSTRPS